jgi:hypothetical protein
MTNKTSVLDEVILVEGPGMTEVIEVKVKTGAQLQEIIVAVARIGNFSPDKAHIFLEDEKVPLNPEHTVDAKHPRHKVHHVHTQKEIAVEVFFNSQEHKMHFSPATTIKKVMAWAAHEFKISEQDATEVYLAIHGSSAPLSGTAHLGRFVPHDKHKLELDVITPAKVNG